MPVCIKDDSVRQWESEKFDPCYPKNYVGYINPYAQFHHDPITPFRRPNMRKFASSDLASFFRGEGSSDSLQPRPPNRFLRSLRQMTSFRARMCLLGASKTKLYISRPFSPTKRNFGSIFDGTWKFSAQKGLTNGDARLQTTIKRHRSPMKVV